MRQRFVELVERLSVFIGKSCGAFYLAAIILSVYEVFTRYVLNAPTVWTTEAIIAMCGTAWMLSAAAVTQQNRHITVTVMELIVGAKMWNAMRKIALLLSLLAVSGLMWANWKPSMQAIAHMERSGSAFNPPVPSYLKVMLMVALVLYALQLLANFLKTRKNGNEKDPVHVNLCADLED
ncbi:TRAP transporter small permease subunit [Cohaesibacter celericrescens]|uniref:TRAP transporter small permease protein n=1 Tax=Cohaesibacter celericrescens TaxID=2067669 RepID=A0A2N5XVQ4_9HYPH|nr:TRAP transporter small permease [Cohaesibacter celericrescens]PLW78579.1 TRAP transporter small permease [Cohaesibacter celericrescens]